MEPNRITHAIYRTSFAGPLLLILGLVLAAVVKQLTRENSGHAFEALGACAV